MPEQHRVSGCLAAVVIGGALLFGVCTIAKHGGDKPGGSSRPRPPATPPAAPADRQTPRGAESLAELEKGVRGAGWMAAKETLPKVLLAPSTAEFPWDTVEFSRMEPLDEMPRWEVRGAVDAENAFGATLRQSWTVVVLRSGKQLVASRVTLAGEVAYESDGYRELLAKEKRTPP